MVSTTDLTDGTVIETTQTVFRHNFLLISAGIFAAASDHGLKRERPYTRQSGAKMFMRFQKYVSPSDRDQVTVVLRALAQLVGQQCVL
jgi:hypothetical protein